MDTISVFIAIAPNHIFNFESIIKNKLSKGEVILLNPGGFKSDKSLWNAEIRGSIDMIYKKQTSVGRIIYQLKKLYAYKKFYKKIASIILKSKIDFYYCNLDDVLTNHLFYVWKGKQLNSCYVVEDGILNYYFPKLNSQRKKMLIQKRLISKLFKFMFEPVITHPTNIKSSIVKAQYVRLPHKSTCPHKSLSLPYAPITYAPNQTTVLILGQDIMAHSAYGEKYYVERVKTLLNHVMKKHLLDNIIYKPHRNGNTKIAQRLVIQRFKKAQIFNAINPIEEVIHKIKPAYVYSFESSAILNLKLALPNANVYFGVLPFSERENPIENLYLDLEIDILK